MRTKVIERVYICVSPSHLYMKSTNAVTISNILVKLIIS